MVPGTFLQAAGVVPIALAAGQRASAAMAPAAAGPAAAPGLAVSDMTAESLVTPPGVDVPRPRLGWAVTTGEQGWSQSAYHIRVATSEDLLQGKADVWDSGQMASAQSAGVEYGGGALAAATRYYWSVQVLDAHGEPSPWSEPSWWETGLLDDAGWAGAQWIAPSEPAVPTLAGAHWIWYPEGPPDGAFPAETRYFRGTCTLLAGAQVTSATLVMTADDYYTVYVNGVQTGSPAPVPNGWQLAQTCDISAVLRPGANTIAVAATNLQASTPGGLVNTPAGVLGHVHVELASGDSADVVTDGSWKAAQTVPSGWEQPGFDDSAWAAAVARPRHVRHHRRLVLQVPRRDPAGRARIQADHCAPLRTGRDDRGRRVPDYPVRQGGGALAGSGRRVPAVGHDPAEHHRHRLRACGSFCPGQRAVRSGGAAAGRRLRQLPGRLRRPLVHRMKPEDS